MQHTLTWNELAEELVKRYGKKQKPVKMVSIDAPEKPEKNNSSAHRPVEPEKSCFSAAEAPDNKQQEHIVEDNKTPENDSVEVNKIAECSSDTLPEMKNNDQRKAWLRAYKDWGLWYEDRNIGVKYYKYDFQNGARLIVEEYAPDPGEQKSWWVSRMTETYYMHLVGGPEPDRAGGVPKWTYHTRYDKFPNSETELCEFLKGLQK